jgi:hypothetical protein
MKSKTKNLSIIGISAVLVWALIIAGCEMVLPQPKDPEAWQERSQLTKPTLVENVIKHISLFRQGVAFDILDNNQSRDATGVITSGNITKVYDDTLAVEQKAENQSIENFLATVNKKTPRWCSYTISTRNWLDNYKIHELKPSSGCKQAKWDISELVYIYNPDMPDKVIKIKQNNKYAGPRSDKAKKKLRFESIQFL